MLFITKYFNNLVLHLIILSGGFTHQAVEEYLLKAVWLAKFTHFVEWPEYGFKADQNFVLATYGKDSFKGSLEKVYGSMQIKGRNVVIKHISKYDELNNEINMLFIPEVSEMELYKILDWAKFKPILLISDTEGYAQKGVHINFYTISSNLRFEMNETALKESGFFVSYRLLNIARIVKPLPVKK